MGLAHILMYLPGRNRNMICFDGTTSTLVWEMFLYSERNKPAHLQEDCEPSSSLQWDNTLRCISANWGVQEVDCGQRTLGMHPRKE